MSAPTDTVREALVQGAAIRPRVGGFPYLAECLRRAEVRHVDVALPTASAVYVLPTGVVLKQGAELEVVAPFDEAALIAAIRADQAGQTTYEQFVASSWAAGVVAYQVDLDVRTCTYRGARGEQYVEHYPAVALEALR
jgi:uncharacterized protein YbcV (DUF1398 family)